MIQNWENSSADPIMLKSKGAALVVTMSKK